MENNIWIFNIKELSDDYLENKLSELKQEINDLILNIKHFQKIGFVYAAKKESEKYDNVIKLIEIVEIELQNRQVLLVLDNNY